MSSAKNVYKYWSDSPKFQDFQCKEDYDNANIRGYEPMTAKELDTEEKQNYAFGDTNNFMEEKFDGTRALVYCRIEDGCRVFSRRISKKTGFYVENTDSVPQIRDIQVSLDLNNTILDGEMFIPFKDFETSCGVMNSKYDRAIQRQNEIGFEVFHAFDILFYNGIDLRRLPLHRRKVYLEIAVKELNSPYIKCVEYHECGKMIPKLITHYWIENNFNDELSFTFPSLYQCIEERTRDAGYAYDYLVPLTPRAYYEYIVATGGEGVIIKPKDGKYHHKRGWEYSKIKKFLTRELILVDYEPPEKEYKGKFPTPHKWDYWEHKTGKVYDLSLYVDTKRKKFCREVFNPDDFIPVSKNYAKGWIGNLILGVLISEEDYEKIPKKDRGDVHNPYNLGIKEPGHVIMEVCTCSGFNESIREEFSEFQDQYIGIVIEVKAQEVFKKTGKLRHPRFLRSRIDKNPEECVWSDHVQ